jgi:hypothetical protein
LVGNAAFYEKNENLSLRPACGQDKPLRCGMHSETAVSYFINVGTIDAPKSRRFGHGTVWKHFSSCHRVLILKIRHPERSEGPLYCRRKLNAKILRFAQNDAVTL